MHVAQGECDVCAPKEHRQAIYQGWAELCGTELACRERSMLT